MNRVNFFFYLLNTLQLPVVFLFLTIKFAVMVIDVNIDKIRCHVINVN